MTPNKKTSKPKLKTKQVTVISEDGWNAFIEEVYGKPYRLQQQDECYPNGSKLTIYVDKNRIGVEPDPDVWVHPRDYCFEVKPLDKLYDEMGVGLDAWLARDPKEPLPDQKYDFELELFWQRNFYPVLDDVVTDLTSKGLLEPGTYVIDISW